MKHGVVPRHLSLFGKSVRYSDHRDFSYQRSVGNSATSLPDLEYNYDAGFDMPDQDAEGFPFACTGYTQTNVAQDFDRVQYLPPYTYKKSLEMIGQPDTAQVGIPMPTSLKSTVVYGVQKPGEMTDEQAETHRQGPYFNVDVVSGMDFFDSCRLALRQNRNRSLSFCTPWFREFNQGGAGGIVPTFFTGDPSQQSWHNHKLSGEKIINGETYLVDKSWQGTGVGDKGWLYFSRQTINALYEIQGVDVYIRVPITSQNIVSVKLTILETALSFIALYFNSLVGAISGRA